MVYNGDMPQDTFTLRLIAKELNETLRGGKINRVNQPGKEELALIIYTGKRTLKLTVNANASDCGAYFTEDGRENPLVAPNFCMLLRKYLGGAEIEDVSLDGFERILVFRMKCFSDFSETKRELRAEIMGKYSNIILTENGTILGALKTTTLDENRKRAVLPGVKYTLPARQDKTDPSDRAALSALLSSPHEDLAHFLFLHVAGLAPCTAEQIVAAYRGGGFADHVYGYLFSDEISPCVAEKDGNVTDFFARYVAGARPFPTLSSAQSYFYEKRRERKRLDDGRRKLIGAISAVRKKAEKRLSQIREKQRECASLEENRIKGELLTANLHALSRGMKRCVLSNYYDENGGTLEIALDETLTPSQNAQSYFKRYRKQKRTLEILAPQEREIAAELDYAESLAAAAEVAADGEDVRSLEEELMAAGILKAPQERRRTEREIPYRLYEKDGFTVRAGRNNLQNDRLVRMSDPGDVWLHTQKYHSCHVVIEARGKEVPDGVLLFAAGICVRYSGAKGGGKVPVDYCRIKYVKKPPKSKAGFVTYSNFKTVLAEPQKTDERDG